MKLLIINLDKSIFKKGSKSLLDLKDYSRFFDKLFVITWTLKKEEPIFFENRLFVYPTNSKSRIFYIFDTFRIFRKIFKNEKIDLISSQDPFETGLSAWFLSKIYKLPLHLQTHVDFLSPYFAAESFLNRTRVFVAKFLIPRASGLRVVSERIKKTLVANGYTLNPIFVLPIFVDIKKIKEAPIKTDLRKKYPQFDFIILMASRFSREKNIELAIKAMSEISKKRPKTGLIIVGEGSEEKNLKSQISNLKIKENIIIESWTNDVVSYYKTASLFLLTSNYEGYGRTVVEAMAAGCPVIMTDVGLAGEILENRESGLVIPVDDSSELVKAVYNIIDDEMLVTRLRETAIKAVDESPNRVDYLKKYEKTFNYNPSL